VTRCSREKQGRGSARSRVSCIGKFGGGTVTAVHSRIELADLGHRPPNSLRFTGAGRTGESSTRPTGAAACVRCKR
jgi:hypothetical protein